MFLHVALRTRIPFVFGAALLASLSASSCVFHDDCGGCGSNQTTVFEQEPNDQASQANWLGAIGAHQKLAIRGTIGDFGPDLYDGFALVAAEPIDVQLTLVADVPSADLDVSVFDPLLNDYVAVFATPNRPETGVFSVLEPNREFHLVVTSFVGVSGYTLYVETFPASFAPAGGNGGAIRAAAQRVDDARLAKLNGYKTPLRAIVDDEPAPIVVGELLEIDEDGTVRRAPVIADARR